MTPGGGATVDTSWYDRPRFTNSTGRQCPDLPVDEGGNMDDVTNTSDFTCDNDNLHVVDVGNDEINTPRLMILLFVTVQTI